MGSVDSTNNRLHSFDLVSMACSPYGSEDSLPQAENPEAPTEQAKGSLKRLRDGGQADSHKQQRISQAVRTILECLGEDVDREGLRLTPDRVARSLSFLTH